MKKRLINVNICMFLLVSLFFGACQTEELVVVEQGNPPTLSGGGDHIILIQENEDETALSLTWSRFELKWSHSEFASDNAVNYILQFDKRSNNFDVPNTIRTVNAGNDLSREMKVRDLNTIATNLGLVPGNTEEVLVRLFARIGENIEPVYSNILAMDITSYLDVIEYPSLYVPGGHQGWDPSVAPTVSSKNDDGLYEGYVYFPDAETEFKFTSQGNWDGINYGEDGPGKLSTDGGAGNLKIEEAGYYRLQLNTEELTWSVTKTTWGIIGDATPNGWDGDTELVYDSDEKTWKVEVELSEGEIKFRANGEWDIDLGDDNGDTVLGYGEGNIAIEEAGRYEIILNLSYPNHYFYSLTKL